MPRTSSFGEVNTATRTKHHVAVRLFFWFFCTEHTFPLDRNTRINDARRSLLFAEFAGESYSFDPIAAVVPTAAKAMGYSATPAIGVVLTNCANVIPLGAMPLKL